MNPVRMFDHVRRSVRGSEAATSDDDVLVKASSLQFNRIRSMIQIRYLYNTSTASSFQKKRQSGNQLFIEMLADEKGYFWTRVVKKNNRVLRDQVCRTGGNAFSDIVGTMCSAHKHRTHHLLGLSVVFCSVCVCESVCFFLLSNLRGFSF